MFLSSELALNMLMNSLCCVFLGSCHDEVSGYRCNCAPGFNGTHCELNIDDCVSHTCNNYSLCEDGVNNYTCVCKPGKSVISLISHMGLSFIVQSKWQPTVVF